MKTLNFYLNPNPPKPKNDADLSPSRHRSKRIPRSRVDRAALANHQKVVQILKSRGVLNAESLDYTAAMFKLADILYQEVIDEEI